MQTLIDLVQTHHRFTRNGTRTNLDKNPANLVTDVGASAGG